MPRVSDQAPTLTLLHNPHCSTSVHALDALEAAGNRVAVRRYLLVEERLGEDELRSLAQRLQGDPPDALIRRDKTYKDLGLDADGLGIDDVVAILMAHPSVAAPAPDPRRRHGGHDRAPARARGGLGDRGPRGARVLTVADEFGGRGRSA
jgi:arsenate reductase